VLSSLHCKTDALAAELCVGAQIYELAWHWQLIRDLARASGLPSALFNITRLAPGSIIADFVIHADSSVRPRLSLPLLPHPSRLRVASRP